MQARQTIERRVNELGVTEPSIAQQGSRSDPRAAARRHRRRAREGDHRIAGPARAEDRRRAPSPSKEALMVNGQVPQGMEIVPGAGSAAGDTSTVYYLVKKVAAVTGQDLRNARAVGRREQPAGGQLHAEQRRRPQVRQGQRREHRPPARDHPRRPRAVGADARERINTEGRITGSFTPEEVQNLSLILRSGALPAKLDYLEEQTIGRRSAPTRSAPASWRQRSVSSFTPEEVQNLSLILRSGALPADADLPRRADDRPDARRRLDPLRRDRVGRRPAAGHRLHARSTTGCPASTRSSR